MEDFNNKTFVIHIVNVSCYDQWKYYSNTILSVTRIILLFIIVQIQIKYQQITDSGTECETECEIECEKHAI